MTLFIRFAKLKLSSKVKVYQKSSAELNFGLGAKLLMNYVSLK